MRKTGMHQTMSVFISHSSKDITRALQIERELKKSGLPVWLDKSSIRLGVLLRNELQSAIKNSRVVVLLWSKAASKSRWVKAEIMTAFHLNRFILLYMCDNTEPPYFLQNAVYRDLQQAKADWPKELYRNIKEAPKAANAVPPFMASQNTKLQKAIQVINQKQHELFDLLDKGNLKGAIALQRIIDNNIKAAKKAWPYDATILNLAGYHYKNAYMLKYDAQIQAGRPPKNRLLQQAERFFFDSLFVNPYDYTSLNGLGSILIYERDIEAAEFFVRRSINLAKQDGVSYEEAKHDLKVIQLFKSKS